MNPKAFSKRQPSGQSICTPRWFVEEYQRRNGIKLDLDVAATRSNRVCDRHLSKHVSAFNNPWKAEDAWLQPPWGDVLPWAHRAINQCLEEHNARRAHILLLAKTETEWFRLLMSCAAKVTFLHPRLNYYDPRARKILSNIAFGSVVFLLDRDWWIHSKATEPVFRCEEYKKPKGAKR